MVIWLDEYTRRRSISLQTDIYRLILSRLFCIFFSLSPEVVVLHRNSSGCPSLLFQNTLCLDFRDDILLFHPFPLLSPSSFWFFHFCFFNSFTISIFPFSSWSFHFCFFDSFITIIIFFLPRVLRFG